MIPPHSICAYCGSQISASAHVCTECGAPVEEAQLILPANPAPLPTPISEPLKPQPSPVLEDPPTPAPSRRETPEGGSSTRPKQGIPKRPAWVIIGLAVIAVCLVVGCLAALAGGALVTLTSRVSNRTGNLPPTPIDVTITKEPVTPESVHPTLLPLPTQLPSSTGREVLTNHVGFVLTPELAQDIFGETIPGVYGGDVPEWDLVPSHTKITFSGYRALGETFHQPQIFVYPTQEYADLSPAAAEIILRLQNLLQDRPAASLLESSLPFLPVWNAAQMFKSNFRYLEFQNGSGIRFLTQFGQAAYPINSVSLIYTFQGLTADERFYVAAIFPTGNPVLPDAESIEMDQAFYDNFQNYLVEIEQLLEAQPDDSFTPDLSLLDQLIESLWIDQ